MTSEFRKFNAVFELCCVLFLQELPTFMSTIDTGHAIKAIALHGQFLHQADTQSALNVVLVDD